MFVLTLQPASPEITERMRRAHEDFESLAAAIFTDGNEYWSKHFPVSANTEFAAYLFRDEDRLIARRPKQERPEGKIAFAFLGGTTRKIYDAFSWGGDAPCAAILRRDSAILLTAGGPNLYIPSLELSAHEVLQDQLQLEADFPGMFEVA